MAFCSPSQKFRPVPALTKVVPSLAVSTQNASLIFRLPNELRLVVLQELLVSPSPISDRETYREQPASNLPPRDKKGRFTKWNAKRRYQKPNRRVVQGYHLTPAVLRTCQQMLNDGLPILYGKNVLDVKIWPGSGSNSTTPITTSESPSNSQYAHAYATVFEGNALIYSINSSGPWNNEQGLKEVAARFNTYSLSLYLNQDIRDNNLRSILKGTASIFSAKTVEVKLNIGTLKEPYMPFLGLWEAPLKSLMFLRCNKFRFVNVSDTAADKLIQRITGKSSAVDLEQYQHNLSTMLARLEEAERAFHLDFGCRKLEKDIVSSVKNFDVARFLDARLATIQTWKNGMSIMNSQMYSKSHRAQKYMSKLLLSFNIRNSKILGLEIVEDGNNLNKSLGTLAASITS